MCWNRVIAVWDGWRDGIDSCANSWVCTFPKAQTQRLADGSLMNGEMAAVILLATPLSSPSPMVLVGELQMDCRYAKERVKFW
jgi:hypothetical protein